MTIVKDAPPTRPVRVVKSKLVPGKRHYRQKFDPTAEFIWLRGRLFNGKQVVPGDRVDKATVGKKLYLMWAARMIGLATWVAGKLVSSETVAKALIGSNRLASELPLFPGQKDGPTIMLGELVRKVFVATGVTVDEWNSISQDDREALLLDGLEGLRYQAAVDAKKALGPSGTAPDNPDDPPPDQKGAGTGSAGPDDPPPDQKGPEEAPTVPSATEGKPESGGPIPADGC